MSFWAAFPICLMAWAMVALSPTVMPAVSASAWPPSAPPYFITEEEFNKLLPYREDDHCPSDGFYTYSAFVTAARAFPKFGREGDLVTRKREIAAFLAQTAAETTGGCYVKEPGKGHHHKYCAPSIWPCVKSRKYFGRGPLQLRWNKNYGDTTAALRVGLLEEPDLLLWNATLAYETGIWFWMTPHSSEIPSCHDVIVGNWKPSARDVASGRLPGYGVISNILASTNGKKQECGFGWNKLQASRIDYYIDYCVELGILTGDNIDCYQMVPFNDPPPQLQLCSSTDTVM